MNANKEKAVELAKNLYIEVNADGTKRYTLQQIAKQIQNKRKITVDLSTISRWAKKNDWDGLFERLKMAGIEKGKEQLQEKENKIIDEKSQTIADIYKSNKQLHVLSQKTILSRLTGNPLLDSSGGEIKSDVATPDLIRILQHSENGLLELLDKRKSGLDVIVLTREERNKRILELSKKLNDKR